VKKRKGQPRRKKRKWKREKDARRARVAGGGNDNTSTTGEKTLDDLDTDGTLANTGHEGVLVLESDTGSRDLLEDVEVERGELARVLPVVADLALEVEEGNLVLREEGRVGNGGGTKELGRRAASATGGLGLGRGDGDVLAEAANDLAVERLDRLHVSLRDLRLTLDELVELLDLVLNLVEL
jgi:hypothetical protein